MTKQRPDSNYNKTQLKIGTKIEMEHTKNKEFAEKIAKDHLDEFPNYYTALVKMENRLKRKKIRMKRNSMFGELPGWKHHAKIGGGVF